MTTIATAPTPTVRDSATIGANTLFTGFILLHAVVWTVLPLMFTTSLPVDTIEGVIWGQGWQLSYVHPPLQAWLLGTVNWLTGDQRWAVYFLGQVLVAVALWAVWDLARAIVTPLGALVSVLTLEGVLFFNFMTPNVFPDLVVLPLWALATGAFYRALSLRRTRDWALLGLWLAAAAYAKYVAAVLAVVMIGFMILDPEARRCWRTPGPYLAAGLCLLLLTPHLWWVSRDGFASFHRFGYSALPAHGTVGRLAAVSGFVVGELALVAVAGLLVLALRGARPGEAGIRLAGAPSPFDRRFVAVLSLGPILLTAALAAASGLVFRLHWGYAMYSLIGLFAVVFVVPAVDGRRLRRFVRCWVVAFLLIAVTYASANALAPYARGLFGWHLLYRYQRESAFPSRQLAEDITRRWHAAVGEPMAYVIGSKWVAGQVAFFSPDHPLVLRNGEPAASPWINMDDLRRRGAIVVWEPGEDFKSSGHYPGWLAKSGPLQRFPGLHVQPPIVLPWDTDAVLPPLKIMWGILYPVERRNRSPRPAASGAHDATS